MHEAQLHQENCFITLTYNDEHLPKDQSLVYRDFQLFMKRLRKAHPGHTVAGLQGRRQRRHLTNELTPGQRSRQKSKPKAAYKSKSQTPLGISFYMSGEYGGKTNRPHYHAILFGIDFHDRKYLKTTGAGEKLYTSDTLDNLWGLGFASVGNVTFESASYVARYVIKKMDGEKKNKYERTNPETGEITSLKPEFSNMSRDPAIGKRWIERYTADVYPEGMTVVNGHLTRPPRYYDLYYKRTSPKKYATIVDKRHQEALKALADSSNQRLAAKEQVKTAQLNKLKRTL